MKKTPLRRTAFRRRQPIKRRPRPDADKVSPGLHALVLARDGACMAPVLDKELRTLCADEFGNVLTHGSYESLIRLQLDHVKDRGKQAMGNRAESDQFHLLAVCPNHHKNGWATSRRGRELERAYLESLRPQPPTSTIGLP